MREGSEFTDFFNQPITEKSKLLVPISGRLRVSNVVKMNKNTIGVSEVNYMNGKVHRIYPGDTVVLSGEDLTCYILRE